MEDSVGVGVHVIPIVAASFLHALPELDRLVLGVVGDVVHRARVARTAAREGADAAVRGALGRGRGPRAALRTAAALQLALVGLVHETGDGVVLGRQALRRGRGRPVRLIFGRRGLAGVRAVEARASVAPGAPQRHPQPGLRWRRVRAPGLRRIQPQRVAQRVPGAVDGGRHDADQVVWDALVAVMVARRYRPAAHRLVVVGVHLCDAEQR